MANEIEILDADNLDYEGFSEFQKKAYARLLEKMKVSDSFMGADYYRWKFHPPLGTARLAIVRDGDTLLSTVSMIPYSINMEGNSIKGWQLCDLATDSKSRGKGYWERCGAALVGTLKEKEILYGFPNKDAIQKVYVNAGVFKEVIKTWAKLVLPGFGKEHPNVSKVTDFDTGIEKFTRRLGLDGDIIINRSMDYLNWRYTKHPNNKYTSFVYCHGEEKRGFATVRVVQALGREVVVLMELWGDSLSVERALMQSIKAWMIKINQRFLVFQDNRMSLMSGLMHGFLPVPSLILPKKHVLTILAKPKEFMKQVVESQWHIQLGDWDGF
jgi:hypothetical protein